MDFGDSKEMLRGLKETYEARCDGELASFRGGS